MPSTPSGTVTEEGLSGGQLLFTDTGSYGSVSSRVLTVYDYQGIVAQVFNMGTNLTQLFTFPADAWFHFQNIVIDNVSGSPWVTDVYVVADGFYWATYLAQFTSSNCGCIGNNCNLEISQLQLQAALRFNLSGASGAASAQTCIVAANFYVNQSLQVELQ